MTHHSKVVGGSNAARRLNCPGSMELENSVPNISSSFAEEGSALHTLMERIFDEDLAPDDFLGNHVGSIPAVTAEHIEVLQWCTERVDKLVENCTDYKLEVWGEFPGIADAGGTCDVSILQPDSSCDVVDYKFGRGVPVYAKDNKQMMFYAACIRERYGPSHTYRVHILQPRLDSHTTWEFSDRDLDAFVNQMQAAIENAGPIYNLGTWCTFCNGEAICPAKTDLAQKVHQWRSIEQEDLPRALSMIEELEDWCKAVRKLAHGALDADGAIQGWKLVDKRATRKWAVDDKRVMRKLQRSGLKVAQYAPRKVISPAQAEKLKVAINDDMVAKNSTGTTLARATDPRPAVSKEAHDLSELSDILSQT